MSLENILFSVYSSSVQEIVAVDDSWNNAYLFWIYFLFDEISAHLLPPWGFVYEIKFPASQDLDY